MASYGDGTQPRRRPDGKWVARFEAGWTERGTRRRRAVVANTERECRRKLRDALRAYREDDTTAINPRMTVRQWCDEWLAEYQQRARPRTVTTDAGMLRRWVVPTIGHRQLSALTVGDLRRVETAVTDAGRSASTRANVAGLLLRVLKAALAAGHAVPRPVLAAKRPKGGVSDRRSIPVQDAARVLATAAARDWPPLPPRPTGGTPAELQRWTGERVMRETDLSRWVAALVGGLRQGEALGLTWECVDLDRGVLDISWQLQRITRGAPIPPDVEARPLLGTYHLVRPKTEAGLRMLPLVPMLEAALRDWRERCPSPDGLVWPRATGTPMRASDDLAAWKALLRAAGVSRLGREYVLHEARHTTATLLTELGVPDPVITRIVGHSSIASTERYRHEDLTRARAALDAVASRLALAE